MSEYVYYEEPVKKAIEVSNCKLCGGLASISGYNHGYCTRSCEIECTSCGSKISASAELNNGGQNQFDLSVVSKWNRLHKEKS